MTSSSPSLRAFSVSTVEQICYTQLETHIKKEVHISRKDDVIRVTQKAKFPSKIKKDLTNFLNSDVVPKCSILSQEGRGGG